MRAILSLLSILILYSSVANNAIDDRLQHIYSLLDSDHEQALILTYELHEEGKKIDNVYILAKTNFILGYILEENKGEFGKAIIHYLEAIRYAERANYHDRLNDLVSLYKNSGIIFKKFKSFELAEKYYKQAIKYADHTNSDQQIFDINYNYAGLLASQEKYDESIKLLEYLLLKVKQGSYNYWRCKNRLGNFLRDYGQHNLAIQAHLESITGPDLPMKSIGYAYHNIAINYLDLGDLENSEKYFKLAIEIKRQLDDPSSLFTSYRKYAELKLQEGRYNEALELASKSEALTAKETYEDYYKIYKLKADILYQLNDYEQSKTYEDIHTDHLNKYLETQKSIQETDRMFNMDLITKRYFDEVEKQERIASILFYSKLISGTLLFLLIAVLAYHRYEKVKLRKSLEAELIDLKILD